LVKALPHRSTYSMRRTSPAEAHDQLSPATFSNTAQKDPVQ
jgi:hypothetical protein